MPQRGKFPRTCPVSGGSPRPKWAPAAKRMGSEDAGQRGMEPFQPLRQQDVMPGSLLDDAASQPCGDFAAGRVLPKCASI
jgi:hypothetical protein